MFDAIACGWIDTDRCHQQSRYGATSAAHDAIADALADLRAQAAAAGSGVVTRVRCFAGPDRAADRHRVWCEGEATAAELAGVGGDLAAPTGASQHLPEARFTLIADAGIGAIGAKAIVSSTLGLRYRPIELGFYIADLQRETVGPRDGGLVGLGLTALARFALGRSRGDAIVGGAAVASFQNGGTNPDFDGLYLGFVGLAYQTPWLIGGTAQPWFQVRAGAAYGTTIDSQVLPMIELHVGLSTPERR